MSELREQLIQSAAEAIDDARLDRTRAYAANDPEIKGIATVAADAIIALIEQSRPSREEFTAHVDTLIQDAYESAMGLGEIGRVDESRREVMRMAGFPEER